MATEATTTTPQSTKDTRNTAETDKQQSENIIIRMFVLFVIVMGMGIGAILLYAFTEDENRWSIVGVALLLATAATLVGGFFGFLFSVPRTILPNGSHNGNNANGEAHDGEHPVNYWPNTNLAEVSDWLTKVIIGASLTQLLFLPKALADLGNYFKPALGGDPAGHAFAVVVVVTYWFSGFFVAYFWTVLRYRRVLMRQERDLRISEELVTQIVASQTGTESKREAKALALVDRQLNPAGGEENSVSYDEFVQAFKDLPVSTRAQIFSLARDKRREGWFYEERRKVIDYTIPLYKALIQTTHNPDDRLFAELGFALKDRKPPLWEEASVALTSAIAAREPGRGLTIYEANRAVCRIKADPDYAQGNPTTAGRRQDIVNDLKTAHVAHANWLFQEDKVAPTWSRDVYKDVLKWMQLNNVTMDDLKA